MRADDIRPYDGLFCQHVNYNLHVRDTKKRRKGFPLRRVFVYQKVTTSGAAVKEEKVAVALRK